jgi:hypothetical protein
MTDRCEPPPELRGVDGWHWVEDSGRIVAALWIADCDGLGTPCWWRHVDVDRYLCSVPSPEIISDLVTALDRIAHMHRAEAMIAITALHAYEPSRRVLNENPLPEIDETIKPPAKYYPERQG